MRVTDLVTESLAARGLPAGGGLGTGGGTLDVEALPAPVQEIVRAAYGDATGTLFLLSACVAVITVLAVVLIRETPLRETLDLDEEPQPVRAPSGHRPPSTHVTNPRLACTRPRTDPRPETRRPTPGTHRPAATRVPTTRDT